MKNFFKIILKIIVQYPICFLLLLLIYLIRPIKLIRIGLVSSWRMGHLAHDLEIYLANKHHFKFNSFDLFSHTHLVSNSFLKKKWEEKVKFINPKLGFPIIKINKIVSKVFKKFSNHEIIFEPFDGNNLVEQSQINITLNDMEINEGWKILNSKGVNKNSKIVCLDVRDNAYLSSKYPNRDWSYQDHRDCNIQNYVSITKYLNEQGYHVFRMGRKVNEKMNYSDEKYFEYCFSEIQSDFLDVFIANICDFVINTGTGWAAIPVFNFRKPALYCNTLPIGDFLTHSKKIMVTTKIHFSKKLNRNLNLIETIKNYAYNTRDIEKTNKIILKENKEDELLLILKEFLDYKKNNFVIKSKEDLILIKNFWKIYLEELNNLENRYLNQSLTNDPMNGRPPGTIHSECLSVISTQFLKKNNFLM